MKRKPNYISESVARGYLPWEPHPSNNGRTKTRAVILAQRKARRIRSTKHLPKGMRRGPQ